MNLFEAFYDAPVDVIPTPRNNDDSKKQADMPPVNNFDTMLTQINFMKNQSVVVP